LGVDDPLDSSAVHLGSGVLGTLMLGLLARPQYVSGLTGTTCGGAFYKAEHAGLQIGMQFLGEANHKWCYGLVLCAGLLAAPPATCVPASQR
jgi:ammonia channel protein AmtB